MENEKLVLYNLHDKLNGSIFTSNSKLSDDPNIKRIGLNSTGAGALGNTKNMLDANAIFNDNNLNVSNKNNGILQPAAPGSVQANSFQVETGIPSYGVPIEPTVPVTENTFEKNTFENPLADVYSEAENFMNSPENTKTFNNSDVKEQNGLQSVVAPETFDMVQPQPVQPVMPSVVMPIQPDMSKSDTVSESEQIMPGMSNIDMPSMQAQPIINETSVASVVPTVDETQIGITPSSNFTDVPAMGMTQENVPQFAPELSVVNNEINATNDILPNLTQNVKEDSVDLKSEIDEVILAIDNAKEKLMALKGKIKKESLENKQEEHLNSVISEVPAIPAINDMPTAKSTMNSIPDINSYFGRAA